MRPKRRAGHFDVVMADLSGFPERYQFSLRDPNVYSPSRHGFVSDISKL